MEVQERKHKTGGVIVDPPKVGGKDAVMPESDFEALFEPQGIPPYLVALADRPKNKYIPIIEVLEIGQVWMFRLISGITIVAEIGDYLWWKNPITLLQMRKQTSPIATEEQPQMMISAEPYSPLSDRDFTVPNYEDVLSCEIPSPMIIEKYKNAVQALIAKKSNITIVKPSVKIPTNLGSFK